MHLLSRSSVSFSVYEYMNRSKKTLKDSFGGMDEEGLEFDSNFEDDEFGQVLSDDNSEIEIIMDEPVPQKASVCRGADIS